MIDKKELISTYLQQFGSHYQISRLLNPTLRIDDEFISHFFEQVVDQYGETFAITEEEKTVFFTDLLRLQMPAVLLHQVLK